MTPSNQSRFWKTIGYLLNSPPSINDNSSEIHQKEEELLRAVRSGNHNQTQLLINEGVDVNATSKNSKTSLHWAVEKNDISIIQDLLAAGAEVNCHDSRKISPLQLAIESGNFQIVQLLLNAGANVNYQALHVAVESQCKDMVEILLVHGADPNATVGHGESVLYRAAESRVSGSDGNDKTYTEILKLLLDYGASMLNDESEITFKPFEAVLKFGTVSAVRLFFKNGMDLSNCGVPLPLHSAARNQDNVLEFLLKLKRFNIEEEDTQGFTVLHEAVVHNNPKCVELLLSLGAKVDCPNHNYETPLCTAVSNNFIDCAKMLLDCGASINDPLSGGISNNLSRMSWRRDSFYFVYKTPWYIALFDNHSECAELLLAYSNFTIPPLIQQRSILSSLPDELRRLLGIRNQFLEVKSDQLSSIFQKINFETMKCIIRRVALLVFQQRTYDEKYFKLMIQFDAKHNNQNAMNYFNDCELELVLLKETLLHDSVTFFDILASKKILQSLLTTSSAMECFETKNLSDIFPIYGEQIFYQYTEAKESGQITEGALRGLSKIFPFDVDAFHIITDNILGRLYKRDLRNLSEV